VFSQNNHKILNNIAASFYESEKNARLFAALIAAKVIKIFLSLLLC
jgi:hypothetical protein